MITLTAADRAEGRTRMPSDESALQGYCASCKRLFEVRWSETVCPDCEHKQQRLDVPEEDGLSLSA